MNFHIKLYKNLFIIICLLVGSFAFSQTEFKIPPKPSKIYPVNDYAHVLSQEQIQELNNKLIAYSDSTSTEILVCTVPSLDGDQIEYVGARWGEEWQIGQKDKNNGLIVLIATNDRKLTIQNGRGTEDAMTDMKSGIIIRDYMVPYLKQNNFYGAINSGTDQIINVLQGKFKTDRKSGGSVNDDLSGIAVAFFIFFFILVIILFNKNNGKDTYYDRRGKRKKDDDDFWGGGFGGGGGFFGGGSFGGGSSSGGGFGGFGGGGSFGGGGASGSW